MSWQATTLVTQASTHSGSDLLCLLMLANYADPEGNSIRPSMPRLATDCRMSERYVRKCVGNLLASGELIDCQEVHANNVKIYSIDFEKLESQRPEREKLVIDARVRSNQKREDFKALNHRTGGGVSCRTGQALICGTANQSMNQSEKKEECSPSGEQAEPATYSRGGGFLFGLEEEEPGIAPQPARPEPKAAEKKRGGGLSPENWALIYRLFGEAFPNWKPRKSKIRDMGIRAWFKNRVGHLTGRPDVIVAEITEIFRLFNESDYLNARGGHVGPFGNGKAADPSWMFDKTQRGEWRWQKLIEGNYCNDAMAFVLEKGKPSAPVDDMIDVWVPALNAKLRVRRSTVGEGGGCRYWLLGEEHSGLQCVIDNGADWTEDKYNEMKNRSEQ